MAGRVGRIAVVLAVACSASLVAVGVSSDAAFGDPPTSVAYVLSAGDTLTPIDLATNTPGTPIGTGGQSAVAFAVSSDGSQAYVVHSLGFGAHDVTPIDLHTGTPLTPISLTSPNSTFSDSIAVSSNGARAYVANYAGLTPIDLATGTVGSYIPLSCNSICQKVILSPDGAKAYVLGDTTVFAIDTATGVASPAIVTDLAHSYNVAISPDGARLYVTGFANAGHNTPGYLKIIDTATLAVTSVSLNGAEALAATADGNKVVVVRTIATGKVLTPIDVTVSPPTVGADVALGDAAQTTDVATSADSATAYVASKQAGTVVPVTIATGAVGTAIPVAVADTPQIVVASPVSELGAAGEFHPVTPARILDTRAGPGPVGKVDPDTPISLKVTGAGSVPADHVEAVVMNVVVTDTTMPSVGFLTVYPDTYGDDYPDTAVLNFNPGETRGNLVTVKVAPNGNVRFNNRLGSVDIVADVMGYYVDADGSPGSRFHGVTPERLVDTRTGTGPKHGQLTPGDGIDLDVSGGTRPPAGQLSGVVLSVTATNSTNSGWITAFPSNSNPPTTANLNFAAGQTISNLVIVGVAPNGFVKFVNSMTDQTDLVVDVVGYYDNDRSMGAGRFTPLDPARVLDTRFSSPLGANSTLTLPLAGTGGNPCGGIGAVVVNVTATDTTSTGWLTVYPADAGSVPLAANLTFVPGRTIPNLVQVKTSADPADSIKISNDPYGSVDVVVDAFGWFSDDHPTGVC